ncbi:MAG TPA: glycosyltransferase [Caldithrix abyssi]|uniref:Glycosyltransferase n=1 Tax=Caldithrix abyssi TaxID=187145 RepID=A0A7V5VE87_CALAY|nr:glycosyltransferase [Caldithrix abyssi]
MKILYLHIAAGQASYRYRVEQYKPLWAASPHTVSYQTVVGIPTVQKLRHILRCGEYDIVILQKKLLHPLLIRAIKKRARLVFDFDDALYARESYKKEKPRSVDPGSATATKRLNFILRRADMVLAGNRELAAYSKKFNSNVQLIPTPLPPAERVVLPRSGPPLRVGWIGNTYNLYYLRQIDDILFKIAAEQSGKFSFQLMSAAVPKGYFKTPWQLTPWSLETEADWLSNIDIGLMPLNDDPWSRGKCAFKLLQYARHGKALIASDVGANREVVRHKVNGFLTGGDFSWEQALKAFVEDPERAARFGQAAREHFSRYFELTVIFKRLSEALNRLTTVIR